MPDFIIPKRFSKAPQYSAVKSYFDGKRLDTCANLAGRILAGGDTQGILQQIDRCASEDFNWLTSNVTPLSITPMHAAAMSGNTEVMKDLLFRGVSPNLRDHRQDTAMHHAGMRADKNMMAVLRTLGGNDKLADLYGGTPIDYLKMTTDLFNPELNSRVTGNAHCNLSHIFDVAPKCIPEGVVMVDHLVAAPKELARRWEQPTSKDRREFPMEFVRQISKVAKSRLDTFTGEGRNVRIAPIATDESGKTLPGKSLCGLVARARIKKREVVARYDGELVAGMGWRGDSEYFIGDDTEKSGVDGKRFRSFAAMSNDGFPNVSAISIQNAGGTRQIQVLLAMEDIPKGAPLVWNYGAGHSILKRSQGYTELRPAAARNFVLSCPWKAITTSIDKMVDDESMRDPNIAFDTYYDSIRASYLLQTPAVMRNMVKDCTLSPKKLGEMAANMGSILPRFPGMESLAGYLELAKRYAGSCKGKY